MKKRILLGAALLSLTWDFFLMVAATFNVKSLLPQIAGGQYDSLPIALRLIYAIQGALVIFQFFFIIQIYFRNGVWSKNSYLLARIFLILYTVSTFVNVVSHSSRERWNALASAIIAIAFYVLAEMKFRPRR